MKISIALTTFNGARYLGEQLASYAAQTRMPDELVACDDASSDDTVGLLEEFGRSAPFPVRVFCNGTNLGFVRNFEQAMAKCTGDLVFLSDQDDVWHPSKIEAIERIFMARPHVSLVVHDGDLCDGNLVSQGATKLSQVMKGFGSSDSLVMGALSAIRRNLIDLALPFPEAIIGHDIWMHRLAQLLHARFVLSENLQSIRRHGANTSNWVASSVKPIGRLDVWRSQYRSPTAANYGDRLSINAACEAVLARIATQRGSFSSETVTAGQRYLAAEKRALLARDALARSRGLTQKLQSVRLLCRGDYRFFNGYMSFLRDVTR